MTMLDIAMQSAGMDRPESRSGRAPPSVCMEGVSKIYHLYENPREQVIHSLGLDRVMFWRHRRAYQEFHALKGIDLTVQRGDRLGIVGRNGAGKTTLLKLITGNFMPTFGDMEVNGSVQAIMQLGAGFHPEFSGYENIRSTLNYNGLVGDAFDAALDDVVDFAELGEFLHQPMKTYSTGMGARVQFAVATAIRPDILIIDEVMGAGDAYFAGKSSHRMKKLTSSGCTLLLVSHSASQVLQFCERAIWLEKGEVKMRGGSLEVVKAYEEFIEQITWKAKKEAQEAVARSPVRFDLKEHETEDFSTAEWQKDRMIPLLDTSSTPNVDSAMQESISRWPAEGGLKIVRVEVFDEHGEINHTIHSGRSLEIEIEFVAEHDGSFQCRIAILIMTLEGMALTRHLSDPMGFRLARGETGSVRLRYGATQLAAGEFVFSAALFKRYDPDDVGSAIRYDILSRSFRLKIVPRHSSEPAYFHHPGEWIVGGSSRRGR